jgi:MFS family permease
MSTATVDYAGISNEPIAPNAKRLLLAGFLAILAAGVGFAIRGGILANWAHDYGFTGSQLGAIGGAGLTGFCFGIIIGGLIADKIGYGPLVIAAFAFHVVSAVISLMVPGGASTDVAYQYLYWGTFIFAIANGTLEGVANPLVATLFPHNRTHYLNILHASWPAGLVLGGFLGYLMGDVMHIGWKGQLGLFLVPTVLYGFLFFGQKMPKSEAAEKGLSFSEMFKDVGILGALVACFLLALFFSGGVLQPLLVKANATPDEVTKAAKTAQMIGYAIGGALLIIVAIITRFSLGAWLLFILFFTHALVGAVELGTDGWIQNITGNILSPAQGKILFVWTSSLMFALRFCANFIEKRLKLSPIGLLMICAATASVGLLLVSGITTFFMAMLALTVYAAGKTFFWPTMLAVASDRFPRTGAIAISIMGGIGMMSAGMIGAPGLGYAKDRFTGEHLQQTAQGKVVYEMNKASKPSEFLFFSGVTGLAGDKLEAAKDAVAKADAAKADGKIVIPPTPDQKLLVEANQAGDRMTLKADAVIPAVMACIYLMLFLYFKATGGYKAVHISGTHAAEPVHA